MYVEFQKQLLNHITSQGQLGDAEKHLLQTDTAKYVRPAYVFACGDVMGIAREDLFHQASAVELMHTATLLHDDIIDEAPTRRGKQSVNALHGSKLAILAGDGLLAKSLSLLINTPDAPLAVHEAAQTLLRMTEAVAIEINPQSAKSITKDELLDVVDGKTGALFALGGYLSGLAGNDHTKAAQFSRIGMTIGRIFQINDDINDIEEDRRGNVVTIPTLLGEDEARTQLHALTEQLRTDIDTLDVSATAKQNLTTTISGIVRIPL